MTDQTEYYHPGRPPDHLLSSEFDYLILLAATMSANDIRFIPSTDDDLSPPERILFNCRFAMIYNWARTLYHTISYWQDWIQGPDHLGVDFWCDMFESGLTTELKKLLAQSAAPSIAQILALGVNVEGRIGSYCKVALSKDPQKLPHYMYVGYSAGTSGKGTDFGVRVRMATHKRNWENGGDSASPFHIKTEGNREKYSLEFVSLWSDPFIHSLADIDEITLFIAKIGGHFSEFVLCKWLSGYNQDGKYGKHAQIWKDDEIDWKGTLNHQSLRENWLDETAATRDKDEVKRDWRQGHHLQGVKTDEEIKQWKADRLAKEREQPSNVKRLKHNLDAEQLEDKNAKNRECYQNFATEDWATGNNKRQREKREKENEEIAKGVKSPKAKRVRTAKEKEENKERMRKRRARTPAEVEADERAAQDKLNARAAKEAKLGL